MRRCIAAQVLEHRVYLRCCRLYDCPVLAAKGVDGRLKHASRQRLAPEQRGDWVIGPGLRVELVEVRDGVGSELVAELGASLRDACTVKRSVVLRRGKVVATAPAGGGGAQVS